MISTRPRILTSGLADGDVISGISLLYEVILTPGTANSSASLTWTDTDGESKTITLRGIANGANVSAPIFGGPIAIRNQDVTVSLSGTAAALAIYTNERLRTTQAAPAKGPTIAGTSNLVSRVTAHRSSSVNLVSKGTVLKESTSNVPSRLTALKETTANLVSRVTILTRGQTSNVVSRCTVLKPTSLNLVCQVTATNCPGTANLPCRITRWTA